MTKKVIFAMLSIIMAFSCGSKDDECTKMMAIPQLYVENNQIKSHNVMEEVPCDFPEATEVGEAPQLNNFSYEVLHFSFIPDTGNNTSHFKFEIKLNNPNNYDVKGIPALTIRSDGMEVTGPFSDGASNLCRAISANSSCIFTFDKEYPLEPHFGVPGYKELIGVKYYIAN